MAIEFQCLECKASICVPDIHGGKKAQCPACKQMIRIPGSEKPPANTTAPAAAEALPGTETAAPQNSATGAVPPPAPPAATPAVEASSPPPPPPPTASAPTTGAGKYIKFACPSCAKMTGFEAKFAGTAQPCPSCKAKVMVPDQSDGESFIVGSVPGSDKPGTRKPELHAHPHAHATHAAHHKPAKRKAEGGGFPVLGAVAGVAAIALIVTAAVYWPRKIPGSTTTTSSTSTAVSVASITPPTNAQPNGTVSTATSTSTAVAPKTATEPAAKIPDEKVGDNDGMEIGARAETPPPSQTPKTKLPDTVTDILGAKENKSRHDDEPEAAATPVPKTPATNDPANPSNDVMKELTKKPSPPDDESKPVDPTKKTPPNSKPPAVVAAPPKTPVAPPAVPVAPAVPALCPQCLGMTTVPITPAKPYLRFSNEPLNAAAASAAVPWKLCPKCQAGRDPQPLVAAEQARLAGVVAANERWEQLTRAKLTAVETHHVTIRSTMPEPEVKNVATALAQLTGQLEQLTQTTVLTQTRPDTDELMIAWDAQGYLSFVNALMAQDPTQNWGLAQTSGGFLLPHRGVFNANRGAAVHPKHMALYQFGELALLHATDGKAPTWLRYGFASYCENVITRKNLVYAFQYEKNEVRFSDNWENEIKKYASQGKLKTWDQAFLIQPIGMSSLDYLTCYSMVSFMMNTDPKLFPKYCLAIKDGLDSEKAFLQVYNMDVKRLQQMWVNWAVTR